MSFKKVCGILKPSRKFKRRIRKGISLLLSVAMLAGSISLSDLNLLSVQAADTYAGTGTYTMGTGGNITSSTLYSTATGYGFSDVSYPNAAAGWVGNIYYPREAVVTAGQASYVTDADGYLAIASKVWTEKESTGYGVYTYENTSTLDFALENADYTVSVELVNPTSDTLLVSLEAEDITKASGVEVAAGATVTKSFTACLVDGTLNLKFLETSGNAAAEGDAATRSVYVSKVTITKKPAKTEGAKPTIFIASDSTVQTYEPSEYPWTGWGQTLYNFFGDLVEERECTNCNYSQSQTYETTNVIIENRAIGGRSSKSFIEEGKLDDLLEDVKPGDYVLIQWGHNDATTARPNRYVSPEDFEGYLQYYIDGVTQRGGTPILVTPVARHSYTTDENGNLISFASNFEAYRQVMLKMQQEQNIPLVDLTARSIALCNEFGIEGAKSLFMIFAAGDYPDTAYAGGSSDSTHLQYYGGYKFAQCVAQGIAEYTATTALNKLKPYISDNAPTTAPGQVTNLMSTSIGATSVAIKWDLESETELYYVYRAKLEDGQTVDDVDFTNAAKYSVTPNLKYTDSSCESGATYVYAVRGFNPKGLGGFSNKIVVTTKAAGWKFDINYGGSPTMEGWTGVEYNFAYDPAVGYGFTVLPGNGRYRSGNGQNDSSDMADDFSLGAGEFAVDLPNGDYEVTAYSAELLGGTSTIKTSFSAEGISIGTNSCKQSLAHCTNTIRVIDGQLNVQISGNNYFNGLTITEILKAPSNVAAAEKSVSGSNMTFLLNFVGVDEAAGYNIYQKSSSDQTYQLIKTFTAEEYAADDLACKAMSVVLGETYEYYMTCYTADGSESARSNIETLAAVLDNVAVPSVPGNVVCVSPTADTTGVQHTITISWDAATVAAGENTNIIKYIIYRSDKAENEKGFTGFEKVGESTATSFTDNYYDLDTNISYYYKVAALNAGGLGPVSAVCQTPVTGTLIPQNLETYADRALVAVNLAGEKGAETLISATDSNGNTLTSGVYLSWRSFEADFDGNNNLTTTFDVYRDGTAIATGLKVTNLVDAGGTSASVYKVVGSNDGSLGVTPVDTQCWANQYLELSLYCPANGTVPLYVDAEGKEQPTVCTYSANDMSLGDLDGDGELELIVKWYPSNAKDNSGYGYTGKTFLDAYDVNFATGQVELLYRIDMGINIRSGAHYTQFQVWDFDGDGKAEIAVKTAPGTTVLRPTDGTAATLAEVEWIDVASSTLKTDEINAANDYRNSAGFVLDGPEYFTMFNGEDGSILGTVDYTPARGSVGAWGDAYGNRVDRFISATAYLDGETPYAVFCRGYYTRTCLTAYYYDKTEGKIKEYWAFDTNVAGTQYEAQGNHGVSVNDIDNDGKDEIIYGSLVVDHDGTVKYSTGLGHGDAMHVSDWVAWNDGLEIMCVHEHDDAAYHVEVHDAETGEVLMGYYTGKDTGRGVAADIDPTSLGAEWWSIASPTYESNDEPEWDSTDGEVYSTQSKLGALLKLANSTPASNASIFWDGDLLSEIQDHTFNKAAYAPTGVVLYKWDYEKEEQVPLFYSTEVFSSNGTKGNLGLIADFLGDWREEIIVRAADAVTAPDADPNKIRIYTTTIQTDYVVPCLLENLAYREGVAWENVGYNQPANLSYLLSEGLVTSQLSFGEITKNSAEIVLTEASDGVYGHDVTAYEIYRSKEGGDYELIDTVTLDQLGIYVPPVIGPDEPEGPAIIGYEEIIYQQIDGGTRAATPSGFMAPTAAYSTDIGYGFTSDVSALDFTKVGVGVTLAGDSATDIETACGDIVFSSDGTLSFAVDAEAGTYIVDVYAGAGYSNNAYNNNKILVNGVDLGIVSQGTTVAEMLKTTEVTLEEDGQIIISAENQGGRAFFNAIVITQKKPVYEGEKDIIGYEKIAYQQIDGGTRAAAPSGFMAPTAAYSTDIGYGFTSDVSALDFTKVGVGVTLAGDSATAIETACGDIVFSSDGTLSFAVDAEAGTYIVDVYAGAGYSNNAYNNNKILVNGVDLGIVSQGTTVAEMLKTTEVTLEEDGQIIISAENQGGRAFFNAIVISQKKPIFGSVIYSEDFEDGASDFVLISDNSANEYLEKDTSTANANMSNYVYGVGSRSGGDTGTQKSGLEITTNATVEFDFKMDACVSGKSSNISLVGSTHTVNWLTNADQILTICGTANGNGYWGTITINGTDITTAANVSNGTANGESSGKGGLSRDTTGWLHLSAGIDFTNQTVTVVLTRISNGSVVYADTIGFVSADPVLTLDSIYMAAGKQYGGVFIDNIVIVDNITSAATAALMSLELEPTTEEAATEAEEPTTAEEATEAEPITEAEEPTTTEAAATEAEEPTTAEEATEAEPTTEAEEPTTAEEAIEAEPTTEEEEPTTAEEAAAEVEDPTTTEEAATEAEESTEAEELTTEEEEPTTAEDPAADGLSISYRARTLVAASEDSEEEAAAISGYYVYTDTTVESDTAYSYKVAAVVDGKTSFMSRPVEIRTLVDIKEIPEFNLPELVQNQVLAVGQTIVDLLPAQVAVIDVDDNSTYANVKWDVSAIDITTPGTYAVTGIVAGWETTLVKNVTVIPNVSTGYQAFEDVIVVVGTSAVLPTKIVGTFLNGATVTETVTWNTSSLNTSVIGDYTVHGSSAGISDAVITVKVVPNYIVSLYTAYTEIALETADYTLPEKVTAVWADGTTSEVAVAWDTTTTPINVTQLGTTVVNGTVEGFDGSAVLNAIVEYPVVRRFDFGITGSAVESGWTGIIGNPKIETGKTGKTVAELGIGYSAEVGYGFTDGTKIFQGRDEGAYKPGSQLADSVYRDYLMPDGNTFRIDVPNGNYVVELVGGCGLGSSTIVAKILGNDISVRNAKADYAIGEMEVEVTDGYITVEFCGSLSRTCAVIVRSMSVENQEPTPDDPSEEPTEGPTEEPSTEEPSDENPTEEPSTEEPSTEEPSSEAPTEGPSSEALTEPANSQGAASSSEAYKAEVGSLSANVLNDDVKEKTNCDTVDELVEYLKRAVTENPDAQGILSGIALDNTTVIDLMIVISHDGGNTWVHADEIPSTGVDVIIPYPENTNKDNYDFVVGHLITTNQNGQTAGTMEYFDPVKTEDGLKIHIYSASPFVVGWKAVENRNVSGSVETGDSMAKAVPVIILVMVISAAAAGFTFYDRKKRLGKK